MKAHLSYFGGSGGFFALWHLLLGTEYRGDFRTDEEFYTPIYNLNAYNDIRGDSWPAHYGLPTSTDDLNTEIQQELLANSKASYSHKLFYQCAPTVHELQEGNYDKKILIYTDYDTQDMLAKNKNAWRYARDYDFAGRARTTEYEGLTVFYAVAEIAEFSTHTILLQDIVKTKGQALLDAFETNTNILNLAHNDMWLNLHTNEEKQRLL